MMEKFNCAQISLMTLTFGALLFCIFIFRQDYVSVTSIETLHLESPAIGIKPHYVPPYLYNQTQSMSFSLDNVVVMVASTGAHNGIYLRERIIPSSRTWMQAFPHVFVIVEDTPEIRYNMRQCINREHHSFTSFLCPGEPVYVLTRVCTSSYYVADGICCKIDESINFLVNAEPRLFSQTKFVLQSDDDTYWRSDQVFRWLSAVDFADIKAPLIGNIERTPNAARVSRPGGVWHVEGCHEIKTQGWYQPMLLNKQAIDRIRNSTADFGITKTCKEFVVSQDVGIGIFAWLLELSHVHIPGIQINSDHRGFDALEPDQMIVHAVRHTKTDDCRTERPWPHYLRYAQHVVIGCGNATHDSPFHDRHNNIDMYDVWNYFAANGTDVDLLLATEWSLETNIHNNNDNNTANNTRTKYVPVISPLVGYNTTEHFKLNDLTNEWTTFHMSDCKVQGKLPPPKAKPKKSSP